MKWQGLTTEEAKKRLERYGKNQIERTRRISPLKIFLSQFKSPLILLLIAAAVISIGLGVLPDQESNVVDAALILIIVLFSGISGFLQDYNAEKMVEALQEMATPTAKVIRDGEEVEIQATEIVPGDLILLESGDIVPADARLLLSSNLKVDESILTGESREVEKKTSETVYMNSFIYTGNAKAIVTETGMKAKVGTIAEKLQEMGEEETTFQAEMASFSKKIFWVILVITILIFALDLVRYGLYRSLLTAISLAVAAIPEGLPAVITLALAIGAKTMARKNALIRRLAVTESIGAVDTICTDKTGTLTKNEMTVTRMFMNGTVLKPGTSNMDPAEPLLLCGALCNNSSIGYGKDKKRKYLGDQTEIALRKISERFGFVKETLDKEYERLSEISFTSKRKMMSVICKHKKRRIMYTKGAPEILLEKCDRIYETGKTMKLDQDHRKEILERNKQFASKALRVLGFAYKDMKHPEEKEERLVWLGLQAMIDPPREEVKQAIQECKTAGIRVIMITGDNPLTAKAIAGEVGMESREALTGADLEALTDQQLKEKINAGVNIFSRVSPFHKLRILELLKKDHSVAMTGDGVNDALALKKADVGVSMGIRGTEVAKEASDVILLDDDFATITSAIKEGRRIFDNIRKFVNYLFVCNFAEVAVIFLATLLLSIPEPVLLPVNLLWINLLTDGFPALALGVDPPRPDIMSEPPRKRGEGILNRRLNWMIGLIGLKKTAILFATFFLVLPIGFEQARTALFTGFIFYEFVRIGSIRYQEKLGWLSNGWLISALLGSVILQLVVVYTPLSALFGIVPLGAYEWSVLSGGILIGYLSAIAITKAILKYVKE